MHERTSSNYGLCIQCCPCSRCSHSKYHAFCCINTKDVEWACSFQLSMSRICIDSGQPKVLKHTRYSFTQNLMDTTVEVDRLMSYRRIASPPRSRRILFETRGAAFERLFCRRRGESLPYQGLGSCIYSRNRGGGTNLV